MQKTVLVLGILLAPGSLAFAQGKPASGTPMTAEQRNKLANAHEKMAACLRSERPLDECHNELMKSCQEAMGNGTCPMMGGMGGMKRGGRGVPPSK